MKHSGIIYNDIASAPGLCTTFFVQGCSFRCPGCHNPDTWDFGGGEEFTAEVLDELIESLNSEGIQRSLCIMGGEPLCEENQFLTLLIIKTVKEKLPNTLIYIWTGYYFKDLDQDNSYIKQILSLGDYLIDGPYIENLRDITLSMRGSSNQQIINLKKIDIN